MLYVGLITKLNKMRTAIFLGLTAIADAIREGWLIDKDAIKFVAIILIVMIVMDVWEFIIKIRKDC